MAEEAAAPAPAAAADPAPTPAPGAATRPEHVPEKFWKDGNVDTVAWADSYKGLEGKLRTRNDDVRKQVEEEFNATRLKNRPESTDKYVAQLPSDFEVPKGMDVAFDDADPLMTFWREQAFEFGLSQEQFEKGLSSFVAAQIAKMPKLEEEMAKLGENGEDRIQRVVGWGRKHLGEDMAMGLEPMFATAKGVETLERLMELAGEPKFSGGDTAAPKGITLADVQAKMNQDAYWDTGHPDHAKVAAEVAEGFKRLSA